MDTAENTADQLAANLAALKSALGDNTSIPRHEAIAQGYSPPDEELAAMLGVQQNCVGKKIQMLCNQGVLERILVKTEGRGGPPTYWARAKRG